MKKLVLLSGGLDSLVMLSDLCQKGGNGILCLNIDYAQKHLQRERVAAQRIAHYYRLEIDYLSICPLYSNVDEANPYVWGRNALLLTYASACAKKYGAEEVYFGASKSDYAGFPDCRQGFFVAMNNLNSILEGPKIITPLLGLYRTEVVKKGFELDSPFNLCYTCYLGQKKSCGKCNSCLTRLQAFKENDMVDPIKYV